MARPAEPAPAVCSSHTTVTAASTRLSPASTGRFGRRRRAGSPPRERGPCHGGALGNGHHRAQRGGGKGGVLCGSGRGVLPRSRAGTLFHRGRIREAELRPFSRTSLPPACSGGGDHPRSGRHVPQLHSEGAGSHIPRHPLALALPPHELCPDVQPGRPHVRCGNAMPTEGCGDGRQALPAAE